MNRMIVLLSVLLSLVVGAGPVCGQPRPRLRLPDADGDGHPLFGNPQIRPGFEERRGDATSVVFADLDGDGDLDAAVTNTGRVTVSYITILINRGDGVFDPPVKYDAGAEPIHIVAADFGGDGVPDLAVANATSNDVSVFINRGDGTFMDDVKYATGAMPRSLVTADFDGDGDNDIATLNTESNDVSVLLNQGNGMFAPEQRVFVGGVTQIVNVVQRLPGPQLACGDLNGDREADLAVPANGRIKLLFGDGNGGFTLAAQHASVSNGSYAVVMGDLDGDGDNDLATVASAGDFGLSVLLNHGDGTFARAVAYDLRTEPDPGALYEPRSLALGDLEGDGDLDIAVGYRSRQRIVVLRNNGDGSFAPHEPYPVHDNPWFVAWADVNGDGADDLAVLATAIRSKLAIMLNDGDGDLITQEETPPHFSSIGAPFPWNSPRSVATTDLDGDGDQDVVVAIETSQDPASIVVMLNNGDGEFDPIVPYPLGAVGASSARHVVVADLNGDGTPDLAVADLISTAGYNRDGRVWVLLGTGGGLFAPAVSYQFSGVFPAYIAPGDVDGDGDIDLGVWVSQLYPGNFTTPIDRSVVILLNDGTGSFTESGMYALGSFTPLSIGSVVLGDFDQDGDLDLVASAVPKNLRSGLEPPGLVTFFLNDGNGIFTAHMQREMIRPMGLTLADFDADGHQDLAVLSQNVSIFGLPCLNIIYGLGGGAFSEPVALIDEHLTSDRISHGDVDTDGDIDLIVTNDYGTVSIILNRGDGTFDRGVHYGTSGFPREAQPADFDGDGRVDLVTVNMLGHNVTLLRNLGSPPCYADCDRSSGAGVLDMLDFLCFQTAFMNADPYACNCDTSTGPLVCDLFDFLCFQNAFVGGCP